MFRCLDRRAQWYLKRNLAVIIKDTTLTSQLTFQPKGDGEPLEILKVERYNRCVVCGDTNLEFLTRHHLVPIEYRQYFPESKKRHNSVLVVSVCIICHRNYENLYAQPFKKELAIKHGIPISGGIYAMKTRLERKLAALTDYSSNIPEERKMAIRSKIQSLLPIFGIEGVNLSSQEETEKLRKRVEEIQVSENETHGKLLISKYPVLEEFEKLWVNHFIQIMKPQFLAEYMNDFESLLNVVSGNETHV